MAATNRRKASNDLPSRIAGWLSTQGYPLEMEVARALQAAGLDVELSDSYQDFDTKLSREIDVTVNSWHQPAPGLNFQVSFHISCKSSPNKPWVSFVSQRHYFQDIPFHVIASNILRVFLLEHFKEDAVSVPLRSLLLFSPDRICHGLTQAFTTGKDVPYEAITTSVKSAVGRALGFDRSFSDTITTTPTYNLCLAFPMVVTDARLFECTLADDNSLRVQEVTSTVLHWKGLNPLHATPLVHVFTKSALPRCRDMITGSIRTLNPLVSPYASVLTGIGENIRKPSARFTIG